MDRINRNNIYIDLVNRNQVNNFGISYVMVKELNNGTSISIDSSGRLIATTLTGFAVIEKDKDYFKLLCLVEESYEDVVKEFDAMNLRIEDVLNLDILIRIALLFSPYWGEMAYEWLVDCPTLYISEFKKELYKITNSLSHTQKFRHKVLDDLNKM